MKRISVFMVLTFLFFLISQIFSYNVTDYNKAMGYLDERGEVYYRFFINEPSDLRKLMNVISVDNIKDSEVLAYANKEEFQKFLESDLYYEVLTPPGLLINPEMSDYTGDGPFDWDKYPSFEGYVNILKKFETDYPELCKLYEIGESEQGRTIYAMKITDNVNENEAEPKFLQNATIHGDETLNMMNMFRMMEYLLSNYPEDQFATRMIDSVEMWITPLMNPDGTYRTGNNSVQGATRYNSNNTDLNRNHPDPEKGLYPQGSWQQETRVMVEWEEDFFFELQIDWHGGIESALWPWACWSKKHPDDAWYEMISSEYAELAQQNSISGYFTWKGGSGNCYVDWGEIHGTRLDYQPYFRHGVGVTIETSTEKLLPESKLLDHWNYNFDAMVNYYSEIFYGVRGMVTDTLTGEGLFAKVFVESHDKDSSWIHTNTPHGDYYRLIYAGNYDITFSCDDYFPKTIKNVNVQNKKATILNVQLLSTVTENSTLTKNTRTGITCVPHGNGLRIICGGIKGLKAVSVYNPGGKKICSLPIPSHSDSSENIFWDGKNERGGQSGRGCYIVHITTDNRDFSSSVFLNR